MKILFLVPYPYANAASQRFRFEQYFDILAQNGIKTKIYAFLSDNDWKIIYNKGQEAKKLLVLASGFAKRIQVLFKIASFDYVFIHRESTPVGPPLLEWLIAKVFKKRIIYDFDDAIWLTDKQDESWIQKIIRNRNKISQICKWSYRISAGNNYLAKYAQRFNKHVVINPTTIDTENQHNPLLYDKDNLQKQLHREGVVIGWTGSHSTLKYLEDLFPVLKHFEEKHPDVSFLVIADAPPVISLKNLIFKKWSKKTEIADLMLMDIGIMPLPDDEWTKGKCGFKALQYMALEIPTIVSPVGVNTEIVENGVQGYCCSSPDEWLASLETLVFDKEKRKQMGNRGRERVIKHYSVLSNTDNFLSLFQ